MAGQKEWKQIPEIVKLTLLAVKDALKQQTKTIKDLQKKLVSKASKNEVNTGLSLKANLSEVGKQVNSMASSLDQKISFEDVQLILRDYALKSEVSYQLSQKMNQEDVSNMIETNAGEGNTLRVIEVVSARVEELSREIAKTQISGSFQEEVRKDMEYIIGQIDTKANIGDVAEALETKANKTSVASALQRKANKSDIEVLIEKKIDVGEWDKLVEILEGKADLKIAQQLSELLDQKAERNEVAEIINGIEGRIESNEQIISQQENYIQSILQKEEQNLNPNSNIYIEREERVKRGVQSNKTIPKQRRDFEHDQEEVEEEEDENEESRFQDQQEQQLQLFQQLQEQFNELNKWKNDASKKLDQYNVELERMKQQQQQNQQSYAQSQSENANDGKKQLQKEFKQAVDDSKEQLRRELESQISRVTAQINDFNSQIQGFSQQSQILSKQNNTQLENVRQYVSELQSRIDDTFNQQNKFKSDINHIQTSVSSQHLSFREEQSDFTNKIQQDLLSKIISVKDELLRVIKEVEHKFNDYQIQLKVDINDIIQQIQSKASTPQIQSIVQTILQENEMQEMKILIEKIAEETDSKVNQDSFNVTVQSIKDTFDQLQKDILLKANIKDVISILDTKTSIKDVNNSIREIHTELDYKCDREELDKIKAEQLIVNKSLCIENIVGRWIWKSGSLKQGNAVPWETEIINTLQDNFLFENNKTSILTVSPGLYQIQLGFFSNQRPSIQLLVNGEPVLVTQSDNYKQELTVTGNIIVKPNSKYLETTIVGTSINEFFTLPPRARISVTYLSGEKGEGFIGLKRL